MGRWEVSGGLSEGLRARGVGAAMAGEGVTGHRAVDGSKLDRYSNG